MHVAGTAAGAAGVDALANGFSGHELSLDGWEVYALRITQIIMLAPVTAQTAVPAKAPNRSTSELLLISCGIARKNHAALKIRYRVKRIRSRQSRPVLIEGIEESYPPFAGRLVELESVDLLLPFGVGAAHDERAAVTLNRRHGLEGNCVDAHWNIRHKS